MPSNDVSLANALAHLGRGAPASGRPVNLPLHQSSTLLFDTLAAFEAAREARYERGTLYYGRYGNPASFELERMMATLEGGHGCVSVSTGLTAVTLALMAALKSGDHAPGRGQRLRADPRFLRQGPQANRGRGQLLRPDDR